MMVALAGGAAITASRAHAEDVGNFYCIGYVISGAYEDCVGASKYMYRNVAEGVTAVCAGAFYPNENRLYGEYNCTGVTSEHSYSPEHLRPVIHNHGTGHNEVLGWVEYIT